MIADAATHDALLIALIGAFGLVLVAVVPVLMATRRNSRTLEGFKAHLPDNGHRLYEMVMSTSETVQDLQLQVSRLQVQLVGLDSSVHTCQALHGGIRKGEDDG